MSEQIYQILLLLVGFATGWTMAEIWKINKNLRKIQDILTKIHKDEPYEP